MKYLFRSMLFVTSCHEKYILKAAQSDADAIIFDLEDSCPAEKEEEGRALIGQYLGGDLFRGRQILIRVNELGTRSLEKDLELLRIPGLLGLMPPKVNSVAEMREFDRLVSEKEIQYGLETGSVKFAPLIETAGAVVNLDAIAQASPRIIALAFGGEDYLDSVWGVHAEPPAAFDVPRALIVQVARKNGMLPIDTPYLDLKNEEGFRREERISADMGFAGSLLVNPRQIPWANEVFSPTAEEIVQARRIVAAAEETAKAGGSITVLDGKMIGPPMRKRAEKVVELAEMIEKRNAHGL